MSGNCVEDTGDNGAANDATDEENPGKDEQEHGNQSPARISRSVKIVLASMLVGVVAAGIARWNFLPASSRYFLPASADDWAAWGTWAGAFGSIGAVFFASQSIKHAIEAQRGTERELKKDRVHDRTEREKERALVREEREALTKEADRIALNDALKLTFKYGWGAPDDAEYSEVQYRISVADREHYEQWLDAVEEDDARQLQSAYVLIQNASKDNTFDDLTLWLREDTLNVTGVEVADRDAPPLRRSSEFLEGEPPKWQWRTDYEPVFPPGSNQWALGSVSPGRQMLMKLSFATPQNYNEWDPIHLWADDEQGPAHPRHLILGYRDSAGRRWIRSTRSARNQPHRLLDATSLTGEKSKK